MYAVDNGVHIPLLERRRGSANESIARRAQRPWDDQRILVQAVFDGNDLKPLWVLEVAGLLAAGDAPKAETRRLGRTCLLSNAGIDVRGRPFACPIRAPEQNAPCSLRGALDVRVLDDVFALVAAGQVNARVLEGDPLAEECVHEGALDEITLDEDFACERGKRKSHMLGYHAPSDQPDNEVECIAVVRP